MPTLRCSDAFLKILFFFFHPGVSDENRLSPSKQNFPDNLGEKKEFRKVHESAPAGKGNKKQGLHLCDLNGSLKLKMVSLEQELKYLIIPSAAQSKSCLVGLSLSKLSSIVLSSENLESPRCQFRLENDNVTQPMPLL